MNMKLFVVAVCLSLLISPMLVAVGSEANDGSIGDEIKQNEHQNSQEIRNWYDLDDIRGDLNGSYALMNSLGEDTAGYEELVNTTKGWEPIGNYTNPFNGSFDGNGYRISSLYIDRPETDLVGLFGGIDSEAKVTDLGLVNVLVSGKDGVGALTGGLRGGVVINSYATGDIDGNDGVAGLVGACLEGELLNSYATADANGNDGVGGLVGGIRRGVIINSYATGDVNGDVGVAGLVGGIDGTTVSNSYATGGVNGEEYVGGLVGYREEGTVENSFWDTETSGMDTSTGGTGKTTLEMKDVATFTNTDTEGLEEPWDFVGDPYDDEGDENIWDIDEDDVINDGYPFLVWEYEVHTLNINIEGEGATEPEEGTHTHYEGEEVNVKAIPEEDWKFVEWKGDYEGPEEEITITMDEDKSITAVFKPYESFFDIEIISYDRNVKEGEYVTVEFTITNTGEAEDTQDIIFLVEGLEEDRKEDVTLEAGEEYRGKFFWMSEEGSYLLQVSSDDDEDTVAITVEGEKIPGFTPILLLLSVVIAVKIHKSRNGKM